MSQTKSSPKRTIHLQELTLKLRATLSPENRTKILKMEIILFQPMVVFFGWFLGNFLVENLESRM